MPRNDLILFFDAEMTGNSDIDELTEVGISALAAPDWQEVDSFSAIVHPSTEAMDSLYANETVRTMLTDNGLVGDIEHLRGQLVEDVDKQLVAWLDDRSNAKHKTTHVPYGGSGVTHFDRKWIDRFLPLFSKRITWWAYDTGNTRRHYQLAGVPWTDAFESKTHRALDDARAHAEEFRYTLWSLETWHAAYVAQTPDISDDALSGGVVQSGVG